jgi:hypothetical protein
MSMWSVYGTERATTQRIEVEKRAGNGRVQLHSDAKRYAHKRCPEIRGLRRCQNVECGVILHRDRNAAINIATNFRRLYSGQPLLRQATAADIKLVTALQALD